VRKFSVFSGHADSDEVVAWLKGIAGLKRVLIVHGESASCDALGAKVRERLGLQVQVPEPGLRLSLGD
jgi:putative mRNA 3-end processing factor